jgi:molybdenum cofactor biosynthesis enzyme MoaA
MSASTEARETLHPRRWLSEVIPLSTPYYLCIEPTNLCNLKCHFCSHSDQASFLKLRNGRTGMMDMGLYKKLIDDLSNFPEKIKRISFAGCGEPLLHTELPEMLAYLHESQIAERIDITTNGVRLSP